MSFNDVVSTGLLHGRCNLGRVGSEVGRYEVVWKSGSEVLKIAFMVKQNPRVLTMRDNSLGADVLVVGEEEPCGCMSTV
jgi:hypothetical protein